MEYDIFAYHMATFIFDLDDTLLDTKRLKDDFSQKLVLFGVPQAVAEQSYFDTKQSLGNYSPEGHLQIISEKYGTRVPDDFSDWLSSVSFEGYLFPESVSTLERLQPNNMLILLTKGEQGFQNKKIKNSGIEKYFNTIHVVSGSKEVFLKDIVFDGPIYFINDKESENAVVKNNFPDFVIIKVDEKHHKEKIFSDLIASFI
jgi:phosphoglycolate phosphatase-like HAD superfamily hydrolase